MNRSEAGKLGYSKSREKLIEINTQRIRDYLNNPSQCEDCKLILSYKKRFNRFCDRVCAARKRNQNRQHKKCKSCDNIPKRGCQYCETCFLEKKNKGKIPKALGECKSSTSIRKFLLKTRQHKCELCELEKWREYSIPLEVDHKNGNSQENTEENLRLICPNCHALTDTWKGKNKGKGRFLRAKRYREGKSY